MGKNLAILNQPERTVEEYVPMVIKRYEKIVVPSSVCAAPTLRHAVLSFVDSLGVDELSKGEITVAVGEAFANAVKYGNGSSEVVVWLTACPESLLVDIEYSGEPFHAQRVHAPDVGSLPNGGLGRYLMQQFMDDVRYSFRNGRTYLRMLKVFRKPPQHYGSPSGHPQETDYTSGKNPPRANRDLPQSEMLHQRS